MLGDLLTPWIRLAALLVPLIVVEKWIHSHLYGVGWLLTNEKKSATALYYLLLSPGVFVHEFTQYLIAGALNVKVKRVMAWPEAQDDGTLRLNFVQVKQAHWFQLAILGAVPFAVGVALVGLISNYVLNLEEVLTALGKADIIVISEALKHLGSTPDFYLWLYLMFAISNAMLPTSADRQGWPLVIAVFGVIIVFLVAIGVGDVLLETFTGPVAHGVDLLATAFATVLVVEVAAVFFIGFAEEIIERLTKRKFWYGVERDRAQGRSRQPGSSEPLPPGTLPPSIYNLPFPIPPPSRQPATVARRAPASLDQAEPEAPGTPRPSMRPALAIESVSAEDTAAPGGFTRPPRLGPAGETGEGTPGGFTRPTHPALDEPIAEDEDRPVAPGGFTRPPRPGLAGAAGETAPGGYSRPARPALDESAEDEDSYAAPDRFARPPRADGLPSRPGISPSGERPALPERPPLRPSQRPQPGDEDADEEPPAGFRRSPSSLGRPAFTPSASSQRPTSPFMKDDEDDEGGEPVLVPFDDL